MEFQLYIKPLFTTYTFLHSLFRKANIKLYYICIAFLVSIGFGNVKYENILLLITLRNYIIIKQMINYSACTATVNFMIGVSIFLKRILSSDHFHSICMEEYWRRKINNPLNRNWSLNCYASKFYDKIRTCEPTSLNEFTS